MNDETFLRLLQGAAKGQRTYWVGLSHPDDLTKESKELKKLIRDGYSKEDLQNQCLKIAAISMRLATDTFRRL